MKRELREELKRDEIRGQKSKLSRLIDDNKGVVKALGIASFVALAGYSAAQLLKDKKLLKKIQDGLKTPKGLKYLNKLFENNGEVAGLIKDGEEAKPAKKKASSPKTEAKPKPAASAKKAGTKAKPKK